MVMNKSIIFYQNTDGIQDFFEWDRFHQNKNFSPDIFSHALHYGRGAFEGIRAVWGKKPEGLQVINFREHTSRLAQSARYLRLMNINPAEVEKNIVELIRRNVQKGYFDQKEGCYVRPLVYSDKIIIEETGERKPGLGVYS